MWFASYGFGVSMFDGKRFINYTKESGLASDNILSMVEDNNGRLWFASDKEDYLFWIMEISIVIIKVMDSFLILSTPFTKIDQETSGLEPEAKG